MSSDETRIVPPAESQTFASGRYTVRRLLGEGAQKTVYLVHDRELDRDCALSLIKTELLNPEDLGRLRREAQAMARLTHANIVTVHDIGEEGGRPYIVCEYVSGGDLRDELRQTGGPFPLDRALDIAQDLCRALEVAHRRDIVHRDLKPENVWLTEDGSAKLGDFGIALTIGGTRLTIPGGIVGTAAYMSPEQALGREATPRSDLYSLGCVVYELVTGRPPFQGDDAIAVISQHINTRPVAPSRHNPDLPQALDALILSLLAKVPEERPKSGEAVREALAALAAAGAPAAQNIVQDAVNPLDRLATGVFVGRAQETQELRNALEEALSSRGRLLLLAGEPGIGKTRLAGELATYAQLRGAAVLWGRCYEGEGAPAYWPWVQLIRSYVTGYDAQTLRSEMGAGAADIAQVVQEVGERLPDLPEPPEQDPEQARFRFFDSMTTFLRNASETQPLVLILDDLHWADKPSLLLLEFLAPLLHDARLLVLGTYRDVQLSRGHPLSSTLGELARTSASTSLPLGGLTQDDVGRFIEGTAGIEPTESLVTAVYAETDGNPFFTSEVVRLLASEGQLEHLEDVTSWTIAIPQGVRAVIGRRLERLSDECNRVLTAASVIGREFGLNLLARVSDASDERLLEIGEEAVAARILDEVPDQVGRFSFSHALIQETLYDELSGSRRVMLHRRVAEALERLYASDLDAHMPELAQHFCQAAPGGDVQKAIEYSRRAAERATAHFAWEEAVAHYQRALQVMDLLPALDERLHIDLLLALAEARLAEGGDDNHRKESALRAADIARQIGDHERFARSVLAFAGPHREDAGAFEAQLVALLEEGLSLIGAEDSALRAKLLVRLSVAVFFVGERERRQALTNEALAIARRLADKDALVYVLRLAVWVWDPGNAEEQIANGRELLALADEVGDKAMTMAAHEILVGPLLEQGDRDGPDAAIDAYIELQREERRLGWGTTWRTMQADLEGRLADAEQLLGQGYAELKKLNPENAFACFSIQLMFLRRQQGRLMELEGAMRTGAEQYPTLPGYRAALSMTYGEAGRLDDARADFETFAGDDFAGIQFDRSWTITMSLLATACTALADARRAGRLYEMLQPYEHLSVVTTISCIAIAYGGSLHRPLGGLATTMSRWADAERHYEAAIAVDLRMRAPGWVAGARLEYARMLTLRADPGDRESALELLTRASDTAQESGMQAVLDGVQALRAELGAD